MTPAYFYIPAVSAFIGWATNVIAVRMLFRPRRPIGIFGFKIQGVIPKRHEALAKSIGELVEGELLSSSEVAEHIGRVPLDGLVATMLDDKLDAFYDGIGQKVPMASMFLTDSLKGTISDQLKSTMVEAIPQLKEQVGSSVVQTLDMRALVEQKVRTFSLPKLEQIILKVASRELKAVEVFGGIIGLLIGLVQLIWL